LRRGVATYFSFTPELPTPAPLLETVKVASSNPQLAARADPRDSPAMARLDKERIVAEKGGRIRIILSM